MGLHRVTVKRRRAGRKEWHKEGKERNVNQYILKGYKGHLQILCNP